MELTESENSREALNVKDDFDDSLLCPVVQSNENNSQNQRSKQNKLIGQCFKCEKCGKVLSSRMKLKYHNNHSCTLDKELQKKKVENKESYVFNCNYCAKFYPSRKCLRQHVQRIHVHDKNALQENIIVKFSQQFKCNICEKILKSKQNLADHVASCANKKLNTHVPSSEEKNGESFESAMIAVQKIDCLEHPDSLNRPLEKLKDIMNDHRKELCSFLAKKLEIEREKFKDFINQLKTEMANLRMEIGHLKRSKETLSQRIGHLFGKQRRQSMLNKNLDRLFSPNVSLEIMVSLFASLDVFEY